MAGVERITFDDGDAAAADKAGKAGKKAPAANDKKNTKAKAKELETRAEATASATNGTANGSSSAAAKPVCFLFSLVDYNFAYGCRRNRCTRATLEVRVSPANLTSALLPPPPSSPSSVVPDAESE